MKRCGKLVMGLFVSAGEQCRVALVRSGTHDGFAFYIDFKRTFLGDLGGLP